jgi:hypothetical protein
MRADAVDRLTDQQVLIRRVILVDATPRTRIRRMGISEPNEGNIPFVRPFPPLHRIENALE